MTLLTGSMTLGQGVDLAAEKNKVFSVCEQYSEAWAAEDVSYVGNGKPFSFKGMRVTWILVKMDGRWVIIHGHWSVPVKN